MSTLRRFSPVSKMCETRLFKGTYNLSFIEYRSFVLTARSGVVAEKTADELFAVDTIGSADIQKQVSKRHKPLKVDEILAQRSAVPAVASRKRLSELDNEGKRKKAKVSGKEYDRLRAIAYGGEQVNKDVVQSGLDAEYDPWAVKEAKKDPKFSFLEEKKAKREPVTLKHAPVSQAKSGKAIPAVRKPAGGKSYNPKFEDWQNELMRESDKAVEAEKRRLQEAREEAERMERAAAETESDSGEESVWESEWEGFSENEDDKLKKKRPERKSLSQRNKIKRRKEAERLARHEGKMKAKEQQVQEIKKLAKSVEAKEKARAAVREALENKTLDVVSDDDGDEELKRRQFRKHP
jgi:nucleolar protein 53